MDRSFGDVVRRLTCEGSQQCCHCCRWKTGKNSVAVVQVVRGPRRVEQTHRCRVVDEQTAQVENMFVQYARRVRALTALSQSQITNDGHWLDDTGVHRDGPCRWKCVAELNHRSSLLSPFNCSIRHTVNRTARLYTVLLSSRILEDKFTSPCPCPRTTKSLKIVKDFAFCKQSVICDP